jgi:transcriptional regulator with XRE-family HTH domain
VLWWDQQGLSQGQSQESLSRVFVARLETARQDPTLSTLVKLARALEVDVAELVSPKGGRHAKARARTRTRRPRN